MRNTLKKTLITHLKKHLVMSKDFYTKAEVDKLLFDQKEEILAIISKKITDKGFALETWRSGILGARWCLELLQRHLTEKNLIEKVSFDQFRKAFIGESIIDMKSSKPLVAWIGQKNLCPYFLDQLDEFSFIKRKNLDKNSNYIFGIKHAAELRVKYNRNKNKLPSNYKIIDEIINDLIRERKLQIEENIYFEESILPEIIGDDINDNLPAEFYLQYFNKDSK